MTDKWIFVTLVTISLALSSCGVSGQAANPKDHGEDCDPTNTAQWTECDTNMHCNNVSNKCECVKNFKYVNNECKNYTNYVLEVTQNYKTNINEALVEQVTKELQASYIYQAYASYFGRADVALPGVKKFFAAASLEEREHAQMLIDYMNERGGYVNFNDIRLLQGCNGVIADSDARQVLATDNKRMCICSFAAKYYDMPRCDGREAWKNALYAFEDALATERFVNRKLLNLHKRADNNKDAHLTHLLEHHFLEEQVSSISQLANYVTRLRSFVAGNNYKLGEYLFDQNLK